LEALAQNNLAILDFDIQYIIWLESGGGEKLTGETDSMTIAPCFELNLHRKTSFVYA
jgi:hypothetical protein